MSDKKRIFIVDGYGQIYRSYFAFMNNPLRDRDGNNVSAVFGFFNTIMSLVRQHGPAELPKVAKCHFRTADNALARAGRTRAEIGPLGQVVSRGAES